MLLVPSQLRPGFAIACVIALLVSARFVPLGAQSTASARPDSAAFVTRLGDDTLAVERVVFTPQRVEADVVLRVPSTTRTKYVLELSPSGQMTKMEAVAHNFRTGAERRNVITRAGDSLRVEVTTDSGARTRTVPASASVLPFVDMVHWPYELALMRARAAGASSTEQPLFTGRSVSDFEIANVGPDSMTITHPARGTMRVRVDRNGRLLGLDAAATTRKLVVERRPWMQVDDLARRWAALDAAGKGVGALSGRGEEKATVNGAQITIDYGTPAKRGREIWGALVPWGTVWRTGANTATHITTDRDLVFGSGADTLVVPAGRYTLFTIPEQGGGTLMINKQTDQGGTDYDQAQDLGRVKLTKRQLPQEVELFTIAVEQEGQGGVLRIQWDRTELVAPFRVRGATR
ncbi:MAG TPA: DUF2911 domain-containing protein [Gemmatimonadaceae bacterium]|nr:DUF2911 domain-containing protein [Gemmatimonadaceae bacterium]